MIGMALKLLVGSLGPYILGGTGAVLALSIVGAGIQTARLGHAKADLKEARDALVDPVTHKKFPDLYRAAAAARDQALADFKTCKDNTTKLDKALGEQSAATDRLVADLRRMTAEAGKAAVASRTALAQAFEASAAIRAPLPAGTACERYEALDAVVVAGLKGRVR